MVKKAEDLAKQHDWFLARQFQNPANPDYHANTTGPEILRDFAGEPLDYWITGWGTGGTMTGAGKTLKTARPSLKIIATEPEQAALLSGGEWSPHKIQGWTPDFIPDVLEKDIADQVIPVNEDESINTSLALAKSEGIFVGISAGATVNAALKVAKKAKEGSVLLAMLPDTAERYLSTPLFADINDGSDDEWLSTL
jgi:cysteine synthase A